MLEGWVTALVGLVGVMFGSFLNVCALRWGNDVEKQSVVAPPSHCPKCGQELRWFDNIPVASWLLLRGRCRHCAEPISIQYPLVEAATGLIWAGCFATFGASFEAARGAIFLTVLLGISISDARYWIIPHEFTMGGGAVGIALSFAPDGISWVQSLGGAALGFGLFWTVGFVATKMIRRLSPQRLEELGVEHALGGGDVWMMMMVGAYVGLWGVGLTIFLGSTVGLVYSLIYMAIVKRRPLIPFGVFLAAGAGVAYVYGEAIVAWYLGSIVGL